MKTLLFVAIANPSVFCQSAPTTSPSFLIPLFQIQKDVALIEEQGLSSVIVFTPNQSPASGRGHPTQTIA